jgi:acetoin:2,6-dichlorophenolindophenol oxidoreductase subunit beta
MPLLSYLRAINRALTDEMARDESVFVTGEDIRYALSNTTNGLFKRFGPDRVLETPASEQAMANFAIGAAMTGRRPVVEYQQPFLALLVFEPIVNQANKMQLMSGGQTCVPVTFLVESGWRAGWGAQHSDQPHSVFPHFGVKTVMPATPTDVYGLLTTAIRDDDPVMVFAPIGAHQIREDVVFADLAPVPLGVARVHREGSDVTVVAVGHRVAEALAVADELADEVSVEVFDPRTLYPFDWDALAASLDKTGRLVVVDDGNRFSGFAAEVVATASEDMHLVAPPRRLTRSDGAVLGCLPELDVALQPSRDMLITAIHDVMKLDRLPARKPKSRSGRLVPSPPHGRQAGVGQRTVQPQPGHAAVREDLQPHVGGRRAVDAVPVRGIGQQPDGRQKVMPRVLVTQSRAGRDVQRLQ